MPLDQDKAKWPGHRLNHDTGSSASTFTLSGKLDSIRKTSVKKKKKKKRSCGVKFPLECAMTAIQLGLICE